MLCSPHPVFCFNWIHYTEAGSMIFNAIPASFKLLSTNHSYWITSTLQMFLADKQTFTYTLCCFPWSGGLLRETWQDAGSKYLSCGIKNKWTWQEAGRRKQKPKCQFSLQVSQFTFGVPFSGCPKHHLFHLLQMCHALANTPKENTVCISGLFCALVPTHSDKTEEILLQAQSFWIMTPL